MKLRLETIAICGAFLMVAACAAPPPKHARLSTEAQDAMKGAALAVVAEPKAEFTRRIKKQSFVVPAGGLIGLAVGLTATAISAAVENAASDIDSLPEVKADIAAMVEERLAQRIVEKAGVTYAPDSKIADAKNAFNFTDAGKDALMSVAQTAGHSGPILNVRSRFTGIVSSGLRQDGDETFDSVVVLDARVYDGKTGVELGKTECESVVPIGTLVTYEKKLERFADAYRKAIEEQAAQSVEAPDADAASSEGSEANEVEAELPPESFEDFVVQSHVKKCEDVMRWQLI